MDFQKYYNDYVGLSPLGKEELMDTFFDELFQEGKVEIWYEETYYGIHEGQVALVAKKMTTPQKFEERKKKALDISEQREEEDFEELSPTGYTISDNLGFFRIFLVKEV